MSLLTHMVRRNWKLSCLEFVPCSHKHFKLIKLKVIWYGMHQHRQRRRTNCKLVNVVQITEMTNYGLGELKLWYIFFKEKKKHSENGTVKAKS